MFERLSELDNNGDGSFQMEDLMRDHRPSSMAMVQGSTLKLKVVGDDGRRKAMKAKATKRRRRRRR